MKKRRKPYRRRKRLWLQSQGGSSLDWSLNVSPDHLDADIRIYDGAHGNVVLYYLSTTKRERLQALRELDRLVDSLQEFRMHVHKGIK